MPTVAFVGDVMLGRGVAAELGHRDPASCWGTVRPVLAAADAVFANLECAISDRGHPWSRTPKVFHFRAPPRAVEVLAAGNIRFVSLANNHVLDYDSDAFDDTLRHLDRAGIAHAGAGADIEAARAPAIVSVGRTTVGVVAATDNEPPWAAGRDRAGVSWLDFENEPHAVDVLAAGADRARVLGAAVVVLSLHWGPNMVTHPPPAFRRLAHDAIRFATVIHGHSAHVFQGIEARRGRLIMYDTGDLLDDYAVHPELRNDWSFVFLVEWSDAGALRELRLVPVRLGYGRVDVATGQERDEICARMAARSGELGTRMVRTDEGLVLPLGSVET